MKIIYLKGSYEDEGLRDFETQILCSICANENIPLAIKIGGCEAKSDIEKSINYGAKCLVAPMIESNFAAKKFISATNPWVDFLDERNINIETITAIEKVEQILNENHEKINGIVIGRTDLALSMGLTKKEVDSPAVMEKVEKALGIAKKFNLMTTIGGSFNTNSIDHVLGLYNKGLLDRFETRKAIMKASSNKEELLETLDFAFKIECDFLTRTLLIHESSSKAALNRIQSIKERAQ